MWTGGFLVVSRTFAPYCPAARYATQLMDGTLHTHNQLDLGQTLTAAVTNVLVLCTWPAVAGAGCLVEARLWFLWSHHTMPHGVHTWTTITARVSRLFFIAQI